MSSTELDPKETSASSERDGAGPNEIQRKEWKAAAEKYIKNCQKFDINVDPSIVIALQTGCVGS
jgi:sensor domain CHASE-containing protein